MGGVEGGLGVCTYIVVRRWESLAVLPVASRGVAGFLSVCRSVGSVGLVYTYHSCFGPRPTFVHGCVDGRVDGRVDGWMRVDVIQSTQSTNPHASRSPDARALQGIRRKKEL